MKKARWSASAVAEASARSCFEHPAYRQDPLTPFVLPQTEYVLRLLFPPPLPDYRDRFQTYRPPFKILNFRFVRDARRVLLPLSFHALSPPRFPSHAFLCS